MKRFLGLTAAALTAAAVFLFGFVGTSSAVPDPVNCTGYPEPRVYLENQSWWEPQEADYRDPNHPGVGKQGHIHVGACFPLHQSLVVDSPDDVLHLDVRVQYHNMTGYTGQFRTDLYGDRNYEHGATVVDQIKHCGAVDCDWRLPIDVPLGAMNLQYGGVHEFNMYPIVWESQTGQSGSFESQYNLTRWYVNIVNGMPSPPVGSVAYNVQQNQDRIGGDSWYNTTSGGQYARVDIPRSQVPWNAGTGELVPISGTWNLNVHFEKAKRFVYIDPALHAVPPNFGTVVYDVTGTPNHTQAISIDTTQLTNGVHKLMIGSANVQPDGTHSGIGVIKFLVANGC